MMGFGFLFMLLLVFVPLVALIAVIILGLSSTNRQDKQSGSKLPPAKEEQTAMVESSSVCSHCGAGLQSGWSYCPQCGAPLTQ
ncbi:MAG: hypothetical protein ANABAC_1421 [Anaerolineae bacterium]|jgi:uncharacterized paraquat-inducible protein A|nr:MAG: hypothetical protein ANABAC_1421 [Anaerolineae bacterium]